MNDLRAGLLFAGLPALGLMLASWPENHRTIRRGELGRRIISLLLGASLLSTAIGSIMTLRSLVP
jgi:hypothetical protein